MSRTFIFQLCTSSLCTLALVIAASGQSNAKRKKKPKGPSPACGLSYLPMVEGTTWKYQYAVPPGASDAPGGLRAKTPETFQVVVKKVEGGKDSAKITLEESYRKVVRTTVLSCDEKEGLIVPIDSFYFSGELPGAIAISVEDLILKGELYPGSAGLKKSDSFYVDVKATIVRHPGEESKVSHPKAKLEMERQITVGSKEDVETEHGIHRGYRVDVALSGRVALEVSADKPVPLPEGRATLWFANGIGLVRSYNRLGQGWELVEYTNAAGEAIE
jgi:hypothetical protein